MCIALGASALSVLDTATAVGGAALSYMGQVQKARTQNALYEANKQAANEAAMDAYGATLQRQRNEEANDTRRKNALQIESISNRGTALASSMNEGNSLDLTLKDMMRQADRNKALIDEDAKIRAQQTQDNLDSIEARTASRIASIQPEAGPNWLQFAVSGLGAYAGSRLRTNDKLKYSSPLTQTKSMSKMNDALYYNYPAVWNDTSLDYARTSRPYSGDWTYQPKYNGWW